MSTSENNKVDGAASFPTSASSGEGVMIVVMVGVTGLTYLALCSLGTNANSQSIGIGRIRKWQDNTGRCTC